MYVDNTEPSKGQEKKYVHEKFSLIGDTGKWRPWSKELASETWETPYQFEMSGSMEPLLTKGEGVLTLRKIGIITIPDKRLNSEKGGGTMLYEATIAFLSLMLLTWGVAVWATFREQEGTETTTPSSEKGHSHRSAA